MNTLNATPRGERLHIGIFGRRNAGKSSLLNALTGQDVAVVSSVKGTTTDPVYKAMELLPIGPVVLIDTPGIDDSGELGELRLQKTRAILRKTDVALLVIDARCDLSDEELSLIRAFEQAGVKYIVVRSKADLLSGHLGTGKHLNTRFFLQKSCAKNLYNAISQSCEDKSHGDISQCSVDNLHEIELKGCVKQQHDVLSHACEDKSRGFNIKSYVNNLHDDNANSSVERLQPAFCELFVSTQTGENIQELKEKIAEMAALATAEVERRIIGDLLSPGDVVVLVTPIDASAPKGRLILPQQQTIRDILEAGAVSVVTQPDGLSGVLAGLSAPPKMVVTDSQAFALAAKVTPPDVWLTSFSILMARHKGVLEQAVRGAAALDTLKDGDRILIAEGCTHHRQCEDIGTVKLPRWIEKYTGVKPVYDFSSGGEFPDDPTAYALIIHCGSCMLNAREMQYRLRAAADVPFTNYGVAISHMQGILARCVRL